MTEFGINYINSKLLGRKATQPSRESADGVFEAPWLLRDGAPVGCDWLQALALEGRCFNIALATPDTTATGETAYGATHPSIVFTVPNGTTVIPFHLDVCFEDATGTDNYILVGCDTDDLYTSGGRAASAANNLRMDSPYTSRVGDIYEGDTQLVITDPGATERTLFSYVNAFADATTSPPMHIVWEPKVCPVLVGPATFYVYIFGSAAPEFSFSVQYAEIPSTCVE